MVNSKMLLFIEPSIGDKSVEPVDDELVEVMDLALSEAKRGCYDGGVFREGGRWRSVHKTSCGECSDNQDYLLGNGMVTNSLASFYLRWYRGAISKGEMSKVRKLVKFYKGEGIFSDILSLVGF